MIGASSSITDSLEVGRFLVMSASPMRSLSHEMKHARTASAEVVCAGEGSFSAYKATPPALDLRPNRPAVACRLAQLRRKLWSHLAPFREAARYRKGNLQIYHQPDLRPFPRKRGAAA